MILIMYVCMYVYMYVCMYVCMYVFIYNSMFARLGTDYEIRNQWFFAFLEAMAYD